MKLIFQDHNGGFRLVGTCQSEQEAITMMHKFCEKLNSTFKIYYIRMTEHQKYKEYDVGSWSEFFILTQDNEVGEAILSEQELPKD